MLFAISRLTRMIEARRSLASTGVERFRRDIDDRGLAHALEWVNPMQDAADEQVLHGLLVFIDNMVTADDPAPDETIWNAVVRTVHEVVVERTRSVPSSTNPLNVSIELARTATWCRVEQWLAGERSYI